MSARSAGASSRRGEHPHLVAGLAQARDRLAHLAHAAALEREGRRAQDGLVADRDRPHPPAAIQVEPLLRAVQHDHPPAALAAQAAEVLDQPGISSRRADRVAGHEGAPGDHAVGQEGVAGAREAVAAVGAQREERQAVAAVPIDEPAGAGAVGVRRAARLAVRAQPVVQRPERAAREQHREAGVRDPVRVRAADQGDRRPCEAGRGHAAGPAGARWWDRRRRRSARRSPTSAASSARLPDRLLDVEPAAGHVGRGRERHERDREDPRPALAPREPAGEQEQRDAGGEHDRARRASRRRAAASPGTGRSGRSAWAGSRRRCRRGRRRARRAQSAPAPASTAFVPNPPFQPYRQRVGATSGPAAGLQAGESCLPAARLTSAEWSSSAAVSAGAGGARRRSRRARPPPAGAGRRCSAAASTRTRNGTPSGSPRRPRSAIWARRAASRAVAAPRRGSAAGRRTSG